jgi:hypothetical protein
VATRTGNSMRTYSTWIRSLQLRARSERALLLFSVFPQRTGELSLSGSSLPPMQRVQHEYAQFSHGTCSSISPMKIPLPDLLVPGPSTLFWAMPTDVRTRLRIVYTNCSRPAHVIIEKQRKLTSLFVGPTYHWMLQSSVANVRWYSET